MAAKECWLTRPRQPEKHPMAAKRTTKPAAPVAGVISFFSGLGILDLGFEQGGFRTYLANEFSPSFARAYQHGRERMGVPQPVYPLVVGSIERFFSAEDEASHILHAAMLRARQECGCVGFIGGPPCPDFSVAGKNAGSDGDNGRLTEDYVRLICERQPDYFLFENVKGLISTAKHQSFFRRMKADLEACGYRLTERMCNAIEYGVAQDRNRIILIGFREASFADAADMAAAFDWLSRAFGPPDPLSLPWPETAPFGGNPDRPADIPPELTIQHWFERNDVENHPNASHYFKPRQALERFGNVPEGDVAGKSFKRPHRWRYSPTAAYGNNEVHLHPYKARRLSAAEVMAIQSLPKEFELPADMTLSDMFKTVGNGVPFLFAKAIAETIADAVRPHAEAMREAAQARAEFQRVSAEVLRLCMKFESLRHAVRAKVPNATAEDVARARQDLYDKMVALPAELQAIVGQSLEAERAATQALDGPNGEIIAALAALDTAA